MSNWIEALKSAGRGDSVRARELLNEMNFALRYPRIVRSDENCVYDGPLAKAVLHAIDSFVDTEDRQLALNNAEDFIDYIVDLIISKVERTIELVEYCLAFPEKGLEAITNDFKGLSPLKRTPEQLQEFVKQRLVSMAVAGVEFAVESVAMTQACQTELETPKLLGFDERYLIKSLPISQKWIDFRQRQRLTYKHESFDLLYDKIAAETSDFGDIADKYASFVGERGLEIQELTEELSSKLNEILSNLHDNKPSWGYRPIAWHRVWWKIDAEGYLGLDCINPECVTDERLAEHISRSYPEVQKMNRLTVNRRRTKLEIPCEDLRAEFFQSYRRTI